MEHTQGTAGAGRPGRVPSCPRTCSVSAWRFQLKYITPPQLLALLCESVTLFEICSGVDQGQVDPEVACAGGGGGGGGGVVSGNGVPWPSPSQRATWRWVSQLHKTTHPKSLFKPNPRVPQAHTT